MIRIVLDIDDEANDGNNDDDNDNDDDDMVHTADSTC